MKEDGSFRLDQRYFDYCAGLTMTSPAFHELFGAEPRRPESPLTQREMDLAASVQAVTEEVVLKLARFARQETGERHLCLAGGVALNCVANGKLLKKRIFDDIWIQPAAGDAGGAVGSALAAWHGYLGNGRSPDGRDRMTGAYLGPAFDQREVEKRLTASGAVYTVLSDDDLIARTVDAIVDEKAVGWMQGRMEFGPRALGGRSILGDPRSPTMQKTLNLKVKYRESFRPFAPSVRREDVAEWFDVDVDSPYMLLVGDVLDRHRLPLGAGEAALFGIDRLTFRDRVSQPSRMWIIRPGADRPSRHQSTLLGAFKCVQAANRLSRIGQHQLQRSRRADRCTPEDAFRCFMGTEIECLVVGNCFLRKEDQSSNLRQDYKDRFELD